jgi:hypothetical protein
MNVILQICSHLVAFLLKKSLRRSVNQKLIIEGGHVIPPCREWKERLNIESCVVLVPVRFAACIDIVYEVWGSVGSSSALLLT